MSRIRPASYSPLQKSLHWLIALLVVGMIGVGLYMVRRGVATKFDAVTAQLYTYHKTIGFAVLWLVVLRAIVRLTRGVPAPEPSLNLVQRLAAEATHLAIYGLLIAVPVLGWIGVSAYGAPQIVGGYSLPALVAQDERMAKTVLWLHGWAAIGLGLLVLAHVGAALMHKVV
ncbi:MAG TPA: cytochrome b, partial [Hyphomicrobiaceae bacterium]|nr:cytochrome b [Hyphomicrobiaceae bacterium]